MKTILYLECAAGISGDMLVGALLDLGADRKKLEKALQSIPVEGFTYVIGRVKKSGIDCCDFKVILEKDYENHDHDMEYLYGNAAHECGYDGGHGHHDHHHHHHAAGGHTDLSGAAAAHVSLGTVPLQENQKQEELRTHEHRGMAEIKAIIAAADLTDSARRLALDIFGIIAEAEAKAHAVAVSEVHFHEVGALDSIVDVIAVAVCADDLSPDEVIVTELCEGRGVVRCRHGLLPVPVPAVLNIARTHGLPLTITGRDGEFVTPTGAAAVAALRTSSELPAGFTVKKVGLGAGKRNYTPPSILRAMLIQPRRAETGADLKCENILKLETDIDDCSGEILGYLLEKLLAAGARDVHYHPVFMKKNRPGWQLNVLCDISSKRRLEEIIFRETTTIGIRSCSMDRTLLDREQHQVVTKYGAVEVKVCRCGSELYCYPEYEDAARIAALEQLPLAEVYEMIREAFRCGN